MIGRLDLYVPCVSAWCFTHGQQVLSSHGDPFSETVAMMPAGDGLGWSDVINLLMFYAHSVGTVTSQKIRPQKL